MSPLKVLFLTHSFPRFSGDMPGSFLLRLARALAAEDVAVRVVAPAAPGLARSEEIEGIFVERFRYAPRRWETLAYTGRMAQDVVSSWTARLAMAGYMASGLSQGVSASGSFAADVVHAHWWFPSGLVARAVKRFAGTPYVTTLHGTDLRLAQRVPASRPVFRHVLRSSARVTAVSSWLASESMKVFPGARVEVAPMPAATDRFVPGGSREPNRFLFAGRLNRQKGLDQLLRAFAAMQRPAFLDVVGEGSDEQSLKLLASQLGVSDRVVWHGQVDQDRLLRFYRVATALVMPSTDEGLGLVAVEGLLCETPVIAFRSGGLPDVVRNGETGILVEPGNTAELAGALDGVLASPGDAAEMARAGRAFAESTFSPQSAALRYATIYREVIAARAA